VAEIGWSLSICREVSSRLDMDQTGLGLNIEAVGSDCGDLAEDSGDGRSRSEDGWRSGLRSRLRSRFGLVTCCDKASPHQQERRPQGARHGESRGPVGRVRARRRRDRARGGDHAEPNLAVARDQASPDPLRCARDHYNSVCVVHATDVTPGAQVRKTPRSANTLPQSGRILPTPRAIGTRFGRGPSWSKSS
jgi:hypothetical protein